MKGHAAVADFATPRHNHHLFERIKVPDGKVVCQ
jgi:hypothetical protein